MNSYTERAKLLLQTNRLADAETELRKALSDNPEDAYAMALLSHCKLLDKKYPEAVELSKKAVSLQAGEPMFYHILANACFHNKDIPRARLAIAEGQRLAPAEAEFFRLRAQIEFYQDNWAQALREAERGLELDPEDVHLINLRAQALVQLNRKSEASQTMDYALHKAPENSYSHANKGWVAIEQDRYDEAVRHFLEALRLQPGNNYARNGLKEAIKGKNLIYRVILKYFLWMNKMQEKNQWAFVIGAYILYQIAIRAARTYPVLAPLLYPIIVVYVLFAFSTWIAKPVSNLFLRLHPLGKHALDNDEKLGSNIAGGLMLGSLLSFAAYYFTGIETLFMLGIVLGISLIPAGGTFNVPADSKARRYLGIYALILFGCGLAWVAMPGLTVAMGVFALGIFLYGWVANYLTMKAGKEF